ncbi:hypothetical protein EV655_104253 [Rhodovulum euryhalinum]|uniref:Integrase-like protein n=1 Tax=Rhodovulum euryhalinum TaxID=35805 RepID=A0A4R2KG30_9RHOB|nr:hypothetical protein EV655_104253 [Rhodovulum euryhalinum]
MQAAPVFQGSATSAGAAADVVHGCRTDWPDRADVFDYIERFYNPKRRHSKLGYLSPMAFEDRAMQTQPGVHKTGSRPPGEDETTVCSMAVPSRQELWEKVKASPGAAWQRTREVAPTLPDMPDVKLDRASRFLERLGEGVETAIDRTRQGGADIADRFRRKGPDHAE